jgi:hypothetical protein
MFLNYAIITGFLLILILNCSIVCTTLDAVTIFRIWDYKISH